MIEATGSPQRITPCLWFAGEAQAAVDHYTAIFPNSAVHRTNYYDQASSQASGMPEGSILTIAFSLDEQSFLALNGTPQFQFTEALSLIVNCDDQAEVDHYWSRLAEGGQERVCGWLRDRYGLSWQIVPKVLPQLLADARPGVAQRAMAALMQMTKLDIDALQQAAGI